MAKRQQKKRKRRPTKTTPVPDVEDHKQGFIYLRVAYRLSNDEVCGDSLGKQPAHIATWCAHMLDRADAGEGRIGDEDEDGDPIPFDLSEITGYESMESMVNANLLDGLAGL